MQKSRKYWGNMVGFIGLSVRMPQPLCLLDASCYSVDLYTRTEGAIQPNQPGSQPTNEPTSNQPTDQTINQYQPTYPPAQLHTNQPGLTESNFARSRFSECCGNIDRIASCTGWWFLTAKYQRVQVSTGHSR